MELFPHYRWLASEWVHEKYDLPKEWYQQSCADDEPEPDSIAPHHESGFHSCLFQAETRINGNDDGYATSTSCNQP